MKIFTAALFCGGVFCAFAQAAEPVTATLNYQQAQQLTAKARQIIADHHPGGAIGVSTPDGQVDTEAAQRALSVFDAD